MARSRASQPETAATWDAIVWGSGAGGLTAAAALTRCGQRVLVLEQHSVAGGLTQTFQRHDWPLATGVHDVSGVGPDPGPEGPFGRILHWLTDGALQFAPCGNPYDIVRLPGFEFGIEHPQAAIRKALDGRFPEHDAAIQAWFEQLDAAGGSARSLMVERGPPGWFAWGWHLWHGGAIRRFSELTLADALTAIDDPQLRAMLGARWGDYGSAPQTAPLLKHALVTQAYGGGAYCPVGRPARFAPTMLPVIAAAGGQVRVGADVREIVVSVPCDANAFGPWLHLPAGERPEAYLALKAWIEERMLTPFRRHFPALAPMLRLIGWVTTTQTAADICVCRGVPVRRAPTGHSSALGDQLAPSCEEHEGHDHSGPAIPRRTRCDRVAVQRFRL